MLENELESLPALPVEDDGGNTDDARRVARERSLLKQLGGEGGAARLDQAEDVQVGAILLGGGRQGGVRSCSGILEFGAGR